MKGIINIIEVMLTGIILILAFYHFFPQYVIRPKWDRALLSVKVRDVLNTIDGLNKTYEFAVDTTNFTNFMGRVLKPEVHGAMVWWKETKDLGGYTEDTEIPYFTQGYRETMVDVEINPSEYSVDSSTVALWHFNEGIGDDTYDETSNDNDGILQNDIDWTNDCKFGSCLEFDGDNDYVEVNDSNSLDITDEITLEAWVKPREFPMFSGIITKEQAYGFYFWNEKVIAFIYVDGGYQYCFGQIPAQFDEWSHVAMTYSKYTENITVFLNGTVDRICPLTPINPEIGKSDMNLTIGMISGFDFNGTIDEVRISDKVRTYFESIGGYDVYSFTLGLGYPY